MRTLNRSAILVTPNEPYLQWAAHIDREAASLAEPLRGSTAIYLVEGAESDDEESRVLRRHFRSIFDAELAAWSEDTRVWPKPRDMATFRAWFKSEVQCLVVDLEDDALVEE